ncbi:MAG: hypothetical protein IH597_14810 [Bacteroidales bacterium]|nr:hypothetical protein [Bacteroidales bacterium]
MGKGKRFAYLVEFADTSDLVAVEAGAIGFGVKSGELYHKTPAGVESLIYHSGNISSAGLVPYTGATGDVDLGKFKLTSGRVVVKGTVNIIDIHPVRIQIDFTGSGNNIDFSADGYFFSQQKTLFATPATGYASINLPHGATPTAFANGDIWTTSSGVFARVNGATKRLDIQSEGSLNTFNTSNGSGGWVATNLEMYGYGYIRNRLLPTTLFYLGDDGIIELICENSITLRADDQQIRKYDSTLYVPTSDHSLVNKKYVDDNIPSVSGFISGTLANGYIPVATGVNTLGNSLLYQDSVNGRIGFGTTAPQKPFQVVSDDQVWFDRHKDDAIAAGVVYNKSRGTFDVPVNCDVDDVIGAIASRAYYNNGWRTVGNIQFKVKAGTGTLAAGSITFRTSREQVVTDAMLLAPNGYLGIALPMTGAIFNVDPTEALHVGANARIDGNLGVNIAVATERLHVSNGNIRVSRNDASAILYLERDYSATPGTQETIANIRLQNSSSVAGNGAILINSLRKRSDGAHEGMQSIFDPISSTWKEFFQINAATGNVEVRSGIVNYSFLNTGVVSFTGNVGIGISPTSQLHTTGSVRFQGLAVNTSFTRVAVADNSNSLGYVVKDTFCHNGVNYNFGSQLAWASTPAITSNIRFANNQYLIAPTFVMGREDLLYNIDRRALVDTGISISMQNIPGSASALFDGNNSTGNLTIDISAMSEGNPSTWAVIEIAHSNTATALFNRIDWAGATVLIGTQEGWGYLGGYTNNNMITSFKFEIKSTHDGNWYTTKDYSGAGLSLTSMFSFAPMDSVAYTAGARSASAIRLSIRGAVGYGASSVIYLGTFSLFNTFPNARISESVLSLSSRGSTGYGDYLFYGSTATSAASVLRLFSSTGTQMFTFRNDGRFGLGITSPLADLVVGNGGRAAIETSLILGVPNANIFTPDAGISLYTAGSIICNPLAGSGVRNVGIDASGKFVLHTITATQPAGSDTEIQYNNNGVFGASSNFKYTALGLDVSGSVHAIKATSLAGRAADIIRSGTLTANNSVETMYLQRVYNSSYNVTGTILGIRDVLSGSGVKAGSLIKATIEDSGSMTVLDFNARQVSGATNIAFMMGTWNDMTSGKLFALKNTGQENFAVMHNGAIVTGAGNSTFLFESLLTGTVTPNRKIRTRINGNIVEIPAYFDTENPS